MRRTFVAHLLSRVYLCNSSDLSHCAFVGHDDVRTTAMIHQCYTRGQEEREGQSKRILQSIALCDVDYSYMQHYIQNRWWWLGV